MFQRPGRQLFTARELTPEVAALYGHLSARQQRSLVQRLVAADTRSAAVARANGVFQQSGQRAYRLTRLTYTFDEPQTAAEANRLYRADFQANHFRATGTPAITRTPVTGGFTMAVSVPGRSSAPGADPFDTTRRFTYQNVSDESALIARARPSLPNPQRYAWSVTRTHASSGITTLTVIAERVVAYLHHGSLDVGRQQHFTRPESDPSFYATSTFAPAPPTPPAGSGAPAAGPTP